MEKQQITLNKNLIKDVERSMGKLGYIVDLDEYRDYQDKTLNAITFTHKRDNKKTITLNLNVTEFSQVILWSSKMKLREEITILNLLLTQLFYIVLRKVGDTDAGTVNRSKKIKL